MRLENKVAIVTGGANGIGLAIVQKFLDEGAKVIISDIVDFDINSLDKKENIYYIKCDVSKRVEVENLIKETVEKFGKLDVMVNNAGIATQGSIYDTSDEVWDKTMAVDLNGVFYGTQIVANHMKENNIEGSIINIASIAGLVGFEGTLAYCAAKGAVVNFTRAASLDLAKNKIRANVIAPGVIKTNMTKGYLEDENYAKFFEANTPLGNVGEVNDIASMAIYLASDESKFTTGTVLTVDGGWTAR